MEIYNDSVKALEFPKKEEKKIGESFEFVYFSMILFNYAKSLYNQLCSL